MDTVKERINKFIRMKHLKKCEFESLCGLNKGYLSTMRKGFGAAKLGAVLSAFPDLNRNWLLFGEGEMLLPAVASRPRTAPSGDDADTLISLIRQRTAEIESLLAALQTVRNVPERDTGRAVHIPYSSAACPAV